MMTFKPFARAEIEHGHRFLWLSGWLEVWCMRCWNTFRYECARDGKIGECEPRIGPEDRQITRVLMTFNDRVAELEAKVFGDHRGAIYAEVIAEKTREELDALSRKDIQREPGAVGGVPDGVGTHLRKGQG
ncbi:MAG TPA: hypothetical protein VEA41_14035 [Salinarimonas sp.]|nr:hypothetical protein [Salinarimonas sp.]